MLPEVARRRIQLSQPQNRSGEPGAEAVAKDRDDDGDGDGDAFCKPTFHMPHPTPHFVSTQKLLSVYVCMKKTKTGRLKMAQFALCGQHKQNDINRQWECVYECVCMCTGGSERGIGVESLHERANPKH